MTRSLARALTLAENKQCPDCALSELLSGTNLAALGPILFETELVGGKRQMLAYRFFRLFFSGQSVRCWDWYRIEEARRLLQSMHDSFPKKRSRLCTLLTQKRQELDRAAVPAYVCYLRGLFFGCRQRATVAFQEMIYLELLVRNSGVKRCILAGYRYQLVTILRESENFCALIEGLGDLELPVRIRHYISWWLAENWTQLAPSNEIAILIAETQARIAPIERHPDEIKNLLCLLARIAMQITGTEHGACKPRICEMMRAVAAPHLGRAEVARDSASILKIVEEFQGKQA